MLVRCVTGEVSGHSTGSLDVLSSALRVGARKTMYQESLAKPGLQMIALLVEQGEACEGSLPRARWAILRVGAWRGYFPRRIPGS